MRVDAAELRRLMQLGERNFQRHVTEDADRYFERLLGRWPPADFSFMDEVPLDGPFWLYLRREEHE